MYAQNLSCNPKNEGMLYMLVYIGGGNAMYMYPQLQNALGKVDKKAMIRNRYNQEPWLSQN